MNPNLENPYWDYFAHLAVAFAEDSKAAAVISQASALIGAKARESLLSMDYISNFSLSAAKTEQVNTIVLEQGYHYFITGLEAIQIAGEKDKPALVSFRDTVNENLFSGGPLVIQQVPSDKNLIPIDVGYQSYSKTILFPERQFFRYVGNRGILEVRAKLGLVDTKKITVLVKGFKICLSEV